MSTALQVVDDKAVAAFDSQSGFEIAQRMAKALASSTLVPESYRGQNGVANVVVALDLAHRMGCSPLMLLQNLDVIHGRPSLRASFLIATINASGKWSSIRFEVRGDDPHAKDYRCRAWATERETGERCEGPWVDWKMVDGEGWSKKAGTKWATMPELMFRYRSAAFFVRVFAPELSVGLHTSDEMADAGLPTRSVPARTATETVTEDGEVVRTLPVADLTAQILATPAPIGAMTAAERRQVEEYERAESDRAVAAKDAEMDTYGT